MGKKYDYLIVGSGLFGATFNYLARNEGKRCLIIEKRSHIGGNIYCENDNGIIVHKYGAHIFHTNNKEIWEFVNGICKFDNYVHCPMANYKGKLYNLPFNMNTFYSMWGVTSPQDAKRIIDSQLLKSNPTNLEEQALHLIGYDIYEKLIKGYTEKQWGRDCKDLPTFIINRIPIRLTFNNNYFTDAYQGIPNGGYNNLINGLIGDTKVILNVDYLKNKSFLNELCEKVIFTGSIDGFFGYKYGKLQFRSLKFEEERLNIDNFQGCAVVNYTDSIIPYTRIIEHKHFDCHCKIANSTIITKEYSIPFTNGCEEFYPINDNANNSIYQKYKCLASKQSKVVFGGRLGEYRYYNMDDVIESAFKLYKEIK